MITVTTEIVRAEKAIVDEAPPSAADLFGGATYVQLGIVPPEPFVPCNPSVLYSKETGWICSVRAVSYRLGIPSDGGSSKNYLARLDADGLYVLSYVELEDATGTSKNPRAKSLGFEDLRLYFTAEGHLRALATACDIVNGGAMPEMCRLDVGIATGKLTHCKMLRGPWSRSPQKNWMVVADGDDSRFIYRAYPAFVVDPLAMSRAWIFNTGRAIDELDFLPASVRGSSQAIPFDGGYLAVVHEHRTKRPLSYSHRFMWFDADLVPRKVTKDFVWLVPGVEFCAGLATDGTRLVASFGVYDREAHLAVLEPDAVRAQLVYDLP